MRALTLGIGLAAGLGFLARDFSQWMKAGMNRKPRAHCIREDKEMRDNISERQLDKAIDSSFPASDPPTYY